MNDKHDCKYPDKIELISEVKMHQEYMRRDVDGMKSAVKNLEKIVSTYVRNQDNLVTTVNNLAVTVGKLSITVEGAMKQVIRGLYALVGFAVAAGLDLDVKVIKMFLGIF
jgi:hypothetical protein